MSARKAKNPPAAKATDHLEKAVVLMAQAEGVMQLVVSAGHALEHGNADPEGIIQGAYAAIDQVTRAQEITNEVIKSLLAGRNAEGGAA